MPVLIDQYICLCHRVRNLAGVSISDLPLEDRRERHLANGDRQALVRFQITGRAMVKYPSKE